MLVFVKQYNLGMWFIPCVITVKWYEQIYSVGFLHLQLIHILVLSPQVTVYSAYVLAKHTQLWNRYSLSYGMESGWCTLHCMQALFRAVTITGVVVRGFRSSSVPVTHEGYLVESRRPLWFGPHKPIALSLTTLSRHSPLATASRSTSIISLCLGSSASLSSQTNRSVFSTLSRDSPVGDSQPLSW